MDLLDILVFHSYRAIQNAQSLQVLNSAAYRADRQHTLDLQFEAKFTEPLFYQTIRITPHRDIYT
jgi:hypothetical protein